MEKLTEETNVVIFIKHLNVNYLKKVVGVEGGGRGLLLPLSPPTGCFMYCIMFKGTVQRELRWVKIGINLTAMKICIAGKCCLPCPKGHHHERSINILCGCSTF